MFNGDKPAFPREGINKAQADAYSQTGLTKREYFAAMAMQGILSGSKYVYADNLVVAAGAVSQADALIEALNKK